MSQNITMAPEATLQNPNYAIKEMPDTATLNKYEAVIKDYVRKTRGWDDDQYEVEVGSLNSQRFHNIKNGIVFYINDKANKLKAEKELAETGGLSTGAGRSFKVVLDIPSLQVVREFKQF